MDFFLEYKWVGKQTKQTYKLWQSKEKTKLIIKKKIKHSLVWENLVQVSEES